MQEKEVGTLDSPTAKMFISLVRVDLMKNILIGDKILFLMTDAASTCVSSLLYGLRISDNGTVFIPAHVMSSDHSSLLIWSFFLRSQHLTDC
jgi:hypothetical protein